MYYSQKTGIGKKVESWSVVVPLHDNSKTAFEETDLNSIRQRLIDQFSGLTAVSVVGSWQQGKKIYSDQNLMYLIDVPGVDA